MVATRNATSLIATLLLFAATPALAGSFPFTGSLEIVTSVGGPTETQLVSIAVSGTAQIDAGVVVIPAGAISAAIPNLSGFSGTLMNAAASFSAGGGGPGSSCPLIAIQEICIPGGGFGGAMRLEGVQQAGQALVVWGSTGTNLGATSGAIARVEAATYWTQGAASVWYYIPESDPTPFTMMAEGSFRGLPSTFTGPGAAGFSLVTPMMVTSGMPVSTHNVRSVATLRVDFEPASVPTGGFALLAILFAGAGMWRLARGSGARRSAPSFTRSDSS